VENLVPLTRGRVQNVDFAEGIMMLDWTLDWDE
jgi:ribosomal 30S subunit maturation factor RimM